MNVKFYELAVGAEFTAFGRAYQKVAMSMAEVLPDGHHVAHPHPKEASSGVEGRTSSVQALPVENRRYGRMKSCATSESFRTGTLGMGRMGRMGARAFEI